jgi:diketogulonate reductase-like aldo/keto reductase
MYNLSEKVIGNLTADMPEKDDFFYATKVWIKGREEGIQQMEASMKKMGRQTMDLMQIHNLVDWKTHLKTLRAWKDEGKIRYIGITHYTDDHHEELEKVMRAEPIDFVQFNYSIVNRNAEDRLLPVAAELGVATLINRPFGEGKLFSTVRGEPLPEWAIENGIATWSQYFLKYIISHPAVTCVIPATANPEHELANIKAGDAEVFGRERMVEEMGTRIA